MKRLFIWEINDSVVEYGLAVAQADSVEEAISLICNSVSSELREELREELQNIEPEIHIESYGFFSESPT